MRRPHEEDDLDHKNGLAAWPRARISLRLRQRRGFAERVHAFFALGARTRRPGRGEVVDRALKRCTTSDDALSHRPMNLRGCVPHARALAAHARRRPLRQHRATRRPKVAGEDFNYVEGVHMIC